MNGLKEMARQAGYDDIEERGIYMFENFDLEAFAKLVAAKEREACARLCEKFTPTDANGECTMADIIRSRGEE